MLQEIALVTQRSKLQKYFPQSKVNELIDFLKITGLSIDIRSEVSLCRDEKDNYLLALAKDSQADFLITGDKDLLVLQQFESTKILTYQEFFQEISG